MNRMHHTVCIVLAAGRGRRLGGPKVLASLGEVTFAQRIRSVLDEVGIPTVWVVRDPEHARDLGGTVLVNHLPDGDMFSSVKVGIRAIHAQWYLIWPVDVPLVSTGTVSLVISSSYSGVSAVQPRFEGRRGHPYLVHRRLLTLGLSNGAGSMRDVFGMGFPMRFIDVQDEAVVLNINTPSDLRKAMEFTAI